MTCTPSVAGQAAIRQAEVAHNGGKTDLAKAILAETADTFEALGVWPDSKAPPTSLGGRYFPLERALVCNSLKSMVDSSSICLSGIEPYAYFVIASIL